ncbi:MAG TPA: hypothetical protein ENH21_06345 [Chromatiales bacterium]|nr:hypothetical protein [Chromatiales bacterium]HEX23035.1 hypothetical protein [Chromatiales bacterium]
MKRISTLALSAALLALTACSDSDDAKPEAEAPAAAPTQQAPAPQSAAPAGHQLSPAQQQALDEAKNMPKQGTVLEMMHAAGYTYMKIDTGSAEPLWIAATMMRAQINDKVQWSDAAVMHNYTSKSLHRTFDKILFVSSASIVN